MLRGLLSYIQQLIAPSCCASCKLFLQSSQILCQSCADLMRPIVSKAIALNPSKSIPVYAIGAYDQPLVSLILAKSSGNRTAARQLGNLCWDYTVISHIEFDYIVPIPLHWSRYAWRGYNQANEMARVISQKSGKPIAHLLYRSRYTPFQSRFKGKYRNENVAGIFSLKDKDISAYNGKRILLIDDVMTSGATIYEAGKILQKIRPEIVIALVAARTA